jgi:hypothetical protein
MPMKKIHAATHEEILTSPAIINPPQQWCNFNNCNNNQIDHVVGSRSRTWWNIFKLKRGSSTCNILTKIGHPQPHAPIMMDNTTAEAVINNRFKPKLLKAMDMQLHWFKDHKAQGQFQIHWKPGKKNLADY